MLYKQLFTAIEHMDGALLDESKCNSLLCRHKIGRREPCRIE